METSLMLYCPSASTTSKPKLKRRPSSCPDHTQITSNTDSVGLLLESFFLLSDIDLDLSLDRVVESRPCDSDKDSVIDCAFRLGSALLAAAKQSARRRATLHNAVVWVLPSDLTIKIFSSLDTRSICQAAATCLFFHKCAADPICYENIDLTTAIPKVNNMVVSTMIQRAGKGLQSLKLGLVPCPALLLGPSSSLGYSTRNLFDASHSSYDKRTTKGKDSFVLTRSCLVPLTANGGASGARLRRLHLFNIERMDNAAFGMALSACPSLCDLEVIGLHVELRQTLESVSQSCPLIERLFVESSKTGRDDSLKLPTCFDLVNRCQRLYMLGLRGFKLHDIKVRVLIKGFRQLKYVDFSTSYSITGDFLRNLGGSVGGNLLEVLILRDCMHLREVEVSRLLAALLAGRFSNLRHLDVSNKEGLASDDDWYHRCYAPSFASLELVFEERPNIRVIADFPSEVSFVEESMTSIEMNSVTSSLSLTSSHTPTLSPGSISYNSDQSSRNDGISSSSSSSSFAAYGENSDEEDYL